MEAFSKNYYAFFISIHAPTRGATSRRREKNGCQIFQSTLLQEERHLMFHMCKDKDGFQSTLLQEERLLKLALEMDEL